MDQETVKQVDVVKKDNKHVVVVEFAQDLKVVKTHYSDVFQNVDLTTLTEKNMQL